MDTLDKTLNKMFGVSEEKPKPKKTPEIPRKSIQRKEEEINLRLIESQLLKYLNKISNEQNIISTQESRLIKIFSKDHRNYNWVRSSFELAINLLLDNKLIRIVKGKNYINGDKINE